MKIQDLKVQYECSHAPHSCGQHSSFAGGSHEPSCFERIYFEEEQKRCLKALKESLAKGKLASNSDPGKSDK